MALRLHKWGGAAEPSSASKPSSFVLLICLGEGGRERHSSTSLPEQKVTVSPFCFTGWEDLFCPCGQSWPCWAVVLLLGCMSSWDRCLVQGALRSLICLHASPALLMCQGRNLPFRASLLWCHSVLLPMWSYPLKAQECVPQYLSEKHGYFLSFLDLCQWKGMPMSLVIVNPVWMRCK